MFIYVELDTVKGAIFWEGNSVRARGGKWLRACIGGKVGIFRLGSKRGVRLAVLRCSFGKLVNVILYAVFISREHGLGVIPCGLKGDRCEKLGKTGVHGGWDV